ncbi:hypothetical protein PORY_001099 [Pneumocystis oryctolagi]|uniref:Uncharacterized protein n=1 Tax=Pneumocystis oryctolagi TaxID=42067 RepID=A0ACB7CF21_9ASCO|nr:hypothetical protein PORY_001099 [Pneumocystis oryctolagi]
MITTASCFLFSEHHSRINAKSPEFSSENSNSYITNDRILLNSDISCSLDHLDCMEKSFQKISKESMLYPQVSTSSSRAISSANHAVLNSHDNIFPAQFSYCSVHDSLKQEFKTPTEYVLYILFAQFVYITEKKLNTILAYPLDWEPNIVKIIGEGVDPIFDKILRSLGYIARNKPKPVIDSFMYWRKSKSETSIIPTFNKEYLFSSGDMKNSQLKNDSDTNSIQFSRKISVIKDRRSLISIFILCRALIEIVKQVSADALGDELGNKLEEIVFNQLRYTNPRMLSSSIIRLANWNLFVELLGWMSRVRFSSVSDRFIADLEKFRGNITKEKELKVEMVIHGMKCLKIKLFPEDALEESSDFIASLAGFFQETRGYRTKYAYANLFHHSMLPMVDSATAELNFPLWVKTIEMLYPKVIKMSMKVRLWDVAFSLATTLLCVSPRDMFLANWLNLIESNILKLRDKTTSTCLMTCIARMTWVYMFRYSESLNTTIKKLDNLILMLFPPGKRLFGFSGSFSLALVTFIRFIGSKYPDYCFKDIIFPLVSLDSSKFSRDFLIEDLSPEKMIVAMKAVFAIVYDLLSFGNRPSFPVTVEEIPECSYDQLNSISDIINKSTIKSYYELFCQMVFKIACTCDKNYGCQIEEKDSLLLKITIPLNNALQLSGSFKDNQMHYELLIVSFEVLSKCLFEGVSVVKVVDMICRNLLHSELDISKVASNALETIAKQNKARIVLAAVSKLIAKYDELFLKEYNVVSSSQNVFAYTERVLQLFVNLLKIWIKQIEDDLKKKIDISDCLNKVIDDFEKTDETDSTLILIEEIESNGLFFVCSQSRVVRCYGSKILRLVAKVNETISKYDQKSVKKVCPNESHGSSNVMYSRLVDIFYHDSMKLLSFPMESLSTVEYNRLQKIRSDKCSDVLIKVLESENTIDTAIWFRVFPKFIKLCFEKFPVNILFCRNAICLRLMRMQKFIMKVAETSKKNNSFDILSKYSSKHSTFSDIVVEQWKLYLVVACSTLTSVDDEFLKYIQKYEQKKKNMNIFFEKTISAHSVFQEILPLLGIDCVIIKDAIVSALECINVNVYRILLEDLQHVLKKSTENTHSLHAQISEKNHKNVLYDLLTEITHVLQLTSHFLIKKDVIQDEWVLNTLVSYVKDIKVFLGELNVQREWEYQKLKRYFCGLLENVYEGVRRTSDPLRWISFDDRVSYFCMIEEWSEYNSYDTFSQKYEERIKQLVLDQYKDVRDCNPIIASLEIEKKNLQMAALSCMASLCSGKIVQVIENDNNGKQPMLFDLNFFFRWVDALFLSQNEKVMNIGCKAFFNLLKHNLDHSILLENSIYQCYKCHLEVKSSQCYFSVLTDVLTESSIFPYSVHQVLVLCLFKIGDINLDVRINALRLLKHSEEFFFNKSLVSEFEAAIFNNTVAVYKRGQYLLLSRYSKEYSDFALMVFSECLKCFHLVPENSRRDVLVILLHWVQVIELQLDVDERLILSSYMVLVNLLEIDVRYGDKFRNEIEELWTALVSGPHVGNIKIILDFLMLQCIERKDPTFVTLVKHIIVYLNRSPLGFKVVDTLLNYLQNPRSMIPQLLELSKYSDINVSYPYMAILDDFFPLPKKSVIFSHGQIALIFMVDLIIESDFSIVTILPLLLHIAFIQLDHYTILVKDQAKEMLITLLNRIDLNGPEKGELLKIKYDLYNILQSKDSKLLWTYDDLNQSRKIPRVPKEMKKMVDNILKICFVKYSDLRKMWGKIAITWATSCPVRHLACRSFEIFRCLFLPLDQNILADMLARLSNTICDSSLDIQGFAMEILVTLKVLVEKLDGSELKNYPQLFWGIVACLNSIHEREFIQCVLILEEIMKKIDLGSSSNVSFLLSVFPPKWTGKFHGLQSLILKGLRSSTSYDITLRVLDFVIGLPNNDIVGNNDRLLFAILANLPRFLVALENTAISEDIINCAKKLEIMANIQGLSELEKIFFSFSKSRFRVKEDFIKQIVFIIRNVYFPEWEIPVLLFMLEMLSNKWKWVKMKIMDILKVMLPYIDMSRPKFYGFGADLISPLLRLLKTGYAQQALEVLEKITIISGGAIDKYVLRLILGDKHVREECEKVEELFGIPDENGWAVAMPFATAATTRSNVHSVFYTLAITSSNERLITPDIQFHVDDYYRGTDDCSATAFSIVSEECGEGDSLDDMVSTLHNLDIFFAEDGLSTSYDYKTFVVDTDSGFYPTDNVSGVHNSQASIFTNFDTMELTDSLNSSLTSIFTELKSFDKLNLDKNMDLAGNNQIKTSVSESLFSEIDMNYPLHDDTLVIKNEDNGNISDKTYDSFFPLHDSLKI